MGVVLKLTATNNKKNFPHQEIIEQKSIIAELAIGEAMDQLWEPQIE